MAQTTILAAQTTAGTSTEVAVDSTPVTIALFSGETNQEFSRVKAKIEQEVNSIWQPFCDGDVVNRNSSGTYLYMTKRSYTIKTPGNYRVVKDPTEASIGVVADAAGA